MIRHPNKVIISAIRFDHDLTGNAERIVEALNDEGYDIVPRQHSRFIAGDGRQPDLPATLSTFGA